MSVDIYYQYRWWLVLFVNAILLLLALLLDIQPSRHRYDGLVADEKRLIKEISHRQSHHGADSSTLLAPKASDIERADKMTATAFANGLVLQKMAFHSSMMHAQFQGNFKQLLYFIRRLAKESAAGSVGEFSYQSGGKIEMDVLMQSVVSAVQSSVEPSESDFISPFCNESEELSMSANTTEKAARFPLHLMRVIGYLQQGSRAVALVQLPDGSMIEVFQNMLIGKEHGIVTEVFHDHLSVLLPNQQRRVV